ncbi:cysteine protease, putative [Entamoeba invadens IP1]|uniref:Cysteine protease, putative n=1 Tax=Entamoeba invadens IP1 TaxID=370355 RepID=A0A0A1UDN2_ENTIV|nr:cysteine protease, putative [Entamoeba invadens IP1]ELP94715.1 cysteine protease, putative [Entamoeba invadens IP1]|eukprot:XP_004261486.1 cysteine protease, putative [Entamoeba invadens IP1]
MQSMSYILIINIIQLTFAASPSDQFNLFTQKYSKVYQTPSERLYRYNIFLSNLREIDFLNFKDKLAQYSINRYSDMLASELPLPENIEPEIGDANNKGDINTNTKRVTRKPSDTPVDYSHYHDIEVPEGDRLPRNHSYCGSYVNYNTERPKIDLCGETFDQRGCGCCYASAGVNLAQILLANLTYYSSNKTLSRIQRYNLSVQRFLDLTDSTRVWDSAMVTYKCCGGFLGNAVEATRYFVEVKEYPYTDYSYQSDNSTCQASGVESHQAEYIFRTEKFRSFDFNTTNFERVKLLKKVLHHYGPFVVSLYTDNRFKKYKKGIFRMTYDDNCVSNKVNHVIVLVGYGVENGEEYFIARNSWGSDWGENGYIRISTRNICAIGKFKTMKKITANSLLFGSNCKFDNQCEKCNENTLKCEKCKDGIKMDTNSGMCMKVYDQSDNRIYNDAEADAMILNLTEVSYDLLDYGEEDKSVERIIVILSILALLLL